MDSEEKRKENIPVRFPSQQFPPRVTLPFPFPHSINETPHWKTEDLDLA